MGRKSSAWLVSASMLGGLVAFATPAHADCNQRTIVYSRAGVFAPAGLPSNPQSGEPTDTIGLQANDIATVGCSTRDSSGVPATAYINPGSTMVKVRSRYAMTFAPMGTLSGLANWSGATSLYNGMYYPVTSERFAQSPWVALDPTARGCVDGGLDNVGSTKYCTVV